MSNENDDEFLPEDAMMEELPAEEEFAPEDEMPAGDETLEELPAEGDDASADPFAEASDEAPAVAPEEEESEPEEEKPIMYRPPHMDLYTVLLVLALIFVSLAATIHFLECPATEYGKMPFKKNSPLVTAPANP